jgi:hypothetical protein
MGLERRAGTRFIPSGRISARKACQDARWRQVRHTPHSLRETKGKIKGHGYIQYVSKLFVPDEGRLVQRSPPEIDWTCHQRPYQYITGSERPPSWEVHWGEKAAAIEL